MEKEFKKYQSLERLNTVETKGIENGICYLFPKLDGTNSSVWLSNGEIKAGSRKRELSLEADNAGFYAYAISNSDLQDYLQAHPTHRLFGEFLVPHTIRTYKDSAWKEFYIFDVVEEKEDSSRYLSYEEYLPLIKEFNLSYIPLLAKLENPSQEELMLSVDKNDFLIKKGEGCGEGVVVKNYGFVNKYGRQTWAKIVREEFKQKVEQKVKKEREKMDNFIEQEIVEKFCTPAFIKKEFAKVEQTNNGWNSKLIPQLLGRITHEFIVEETKNFVKAFKYPTVNFKELNKLVIEKTKEVLPEIF